VPGLYRKEGNGPITAQAAGILLPVWTISPHTGLKVRLGQLLTADKFDAVSSAEMQDGCGAGLTQSEGDAQDTYSH
jgi:hypothetical protein